MFENNTNQSWLYGTSACDGNFKNALRRATAEELQEVLVALPEAGNKTKIAVIQREIKKKRQR